ncbi:MAG: hypothetical protein ACI4FZ_10760 [Lachnospiraceae bacterium]
MRKQIGKRMIAAALCCLVGLTSSPVMEACAADGSSYVYDGYIYDFWGQAQECPAAFSLGGIIDSDSMDAFDFGSIDDVSTSRDGRIFLADKTNGRVNVFDTDGAFLISIKVLRAPDGKIALNEDGSQVTLSAPTGTYYHDKNDELYIADSGNKKVFVLDGKTYQVKKIIGTPENLSGVTEYVPSKVAVDMADRIYIVVQSSYEGIIELNEDGTFSRYFGVNVPGVNLIDFFWKSLATDTQKEKMGKTYAPAFTNVTMDSEGFVYAVTNDSAAVDSVFRLNSKGENVLREMGWQVIGDLNTLDAGSSFIDIAVTDYGVYAVLDSTKGRIFLYDYDGQILNIFGGYGKVKGQFSKPTSLAWSGYNLIVTDTDLRCAYVLTPTEFGDVALRASEAYYNGDWDTATELFHECIRWNSNYEVAYTGIGKNHLMKDEYKEAMYYFKLGNARAYYSDAYNGYRGELIRDNFWVVAVLFVVLVTALVVSEVRYHKKNKI